MRVLFLTPTLQVGSYERQMVLLAPGLREQGHEVLVCALVRGGPLQSPLLTSGVCVEVLGNGRWLDVRPWHRLYQHLRRFRPDVVHCWRSWSSAERLALFASESRAAILATVTPPRVHRNPWLQDLASSWLLRVPRWIVPGVSSIDRWLRAGVPSHRITAIPPAVGPPSDCSSSSLRHSLSLPPDAQVILCAGRLLLVNGFRTAIWTLDILRYLFPQVTLLIAGEGPDRLRLEEFARDIGISDNVRFLGWRDDLPALLELADVVWVPGEDDDLPLFALEAMAAGRPVVASRTAALEALIQQGENGWLVPAGDKPALARQTRCLLEQPDLCRILGEKARRTAARFTPAAMIASHRQLYQEVVDMRLSA
jgi:glycosyltransferase involved in cell wall biosynthesis